MINISGVTGGDGESPDGNSLMTTPLATASCSSGACPSAFLIVPGKRAYFARTESLGEERPEPGGETAAGIAFLRLDEQLLSVDPDD